MARDPETTYLLWVDDYNLGDPLFAQNLARHLAQSRHGELRVALVHGSGERAERMMEAIGKVPTRRDGVFETTGESGRRLVERALREANKDLTATLTEFGVPSVGIQGSDRGLIRWIDGKPQTESSGWLRGIMNTGTVPVISSLAAEADVAREIAIADAFAGVTRTFSANEAVAVAFLKSGGHGGSSDGNSLRQISRSDLKKHVSPEQVRVLISLSGDGYRVRLTSARHAISADLGRFVMLSSEKSP